MSHTCYEEPLPCLPCAYLRTKQCACGKKEMGNVKCSVERGTVSCAATCGRSVHRMSGFETIHRMTAPGFWAVDFTIVRNCVMQVIAGRVHLIVVKITVFGMSTFAYAVPLLTHLKSPPVHHPCTLHAPSACPEDEPCEALVMASCP